MLLLRAEVVSSSPLLVQQYGTATAVEADALVSYTPAEGDQVIITRLECGVLVLGSLTAPVAAWIDLTLQSGFTSTDGGAGGDASAQACLFDGVVYLQGVVHGTFTGGTTYTIVAAGGIPAGMRPLHKLNRIGFEQAGDGGRIIVNNDGSVHVIPKTTSTYVDLSSAGGYLAEV